MCLAVPGKIVSIDGQDAVVDFQGNRVRVCSVLTPAALANDWVLVHAGFAIAQLEEKAARETWDYLKQINETEMSEAIGLGENDNDA
jgi:hydrogenase expression/formation protein HypC